VIYSIIRYKILGLENNLVSLKFSCVEVQPESPHPISGTLEMLGGSLNIKGPITASKALSLVWFTKDGESVAAGAHVHRYPVAQHTKVDSYSN
jgi:hypothetical protein